jgi:hypothetical protein
VSHFVRHKDGSSWTSVLQVSVSYFVINSVLLYARHSVVDQLNELADQWNAAIQERHLARTESVLLLLEELRITPLEFIQSNNVGKRIRTSAVSGFANQSLSERIDAIRKHWRWVMDNKANFSKLLGQFVALPMQFSIDHIIDLVHLILIHGFLDLQHLFGAKDNVWKTKNISLRYSVQALVKYVTRRTNQESARKSVLDTLNILLDSSADDDRRIVRPESGPRAAVANANLSSMTRDEKQRRLNDSVVEVTIDSLVSRRSCVSAVRGYLYFVRDISPLEVPLPPQVEWLTLWSQFFKSAGTYANYLSAVKWASDGCSITTDVFYHPLVKKESEEFSKAGDPSEGQKVDMR